MFLAEKWQISSYETERLLISSNRFLATDDLHMNHVTGTDFGQLFESCPRGAPLSSTPCNE